jgi:MFS family permease
LEKSNKNLFFISAAQLFSDFGFQFYYLIIPILAISTLQASGTEMGFMMSLGAVSAIVAPLVGDIVDLYRSKSNLMIVSDIMRALAFGLLYLAFEFNLASLPLLAVFLIMLNILGLSFDIAKNSYVALGFTGLSKVNSRFYLITASSELLGPLATALVVGTANANFALLVASFGYLLSAFFLLFSEENRFVSGAFKKKPLRDRYLDSASEAWKDIRRNNKLLLIFLYVTAWTTCAKIVMASYFIAAIDLFGLSSPQLAATITTGGIGSILSSVLAVFLYSRVSVTILAGMFFSILPPVGILLAVTKVSGFGKVYLLGGILFSLFLGAGVLNIVSTTYRQQLLEPSRLGRVNSLFYLSRFLAITLGSLLGGMAYDFGGIYAISAIITVIYVFILSLTISISAKETHRAERGQG